MVTVNHLQTEDMHVVLNKGSYGVFLVGGGGYGSISMMGAASGYFSYTVVQIEADLTRADVDIGGGGYVSTRRTNSKLGKHIFFSVWTC